MDGESKPAAEPLERAHALPARFYRGEEVLERERACVFGRSWQLVSHAGELQAAGDHVVSEVGRTPVLVVRGEDGVLRAFPNVCRHRAGPLAWCSGKGARVLRCKYHGWTYGLEGSLRAAPEMEAARDFDPGSVHLPPLPLREWEGLVFVALHEDVPDFDAVYGGIVERIHPLALGALRFQARTTYEVACNWKVYVDNFLEGYHLPYVHPGLSRVLDYRAYETHLSRWYSLQHSPLRSAGAGVYGDGDAYYYFVYPNVMLNILPGRMQTNRILPLGPERCRVEFDYYYAQDDKAMSRIAADQAFSDEVQIEDVTICEAVQKGLASGFYEAGRLCPKREGGVWHFQNLLRAAYAGDAGASA